MARGPEALKASPSLREHAAIEAQKPGADLLRFMRELKLVVAARIRPEWLSAVTRAGFA